MPALQFTRDLRDAILAGRKSQTLRAKLARGATIGSRLTLQNGYSPGAVFGHSQIVAIDHVAACDLTHEDAVLDGFATLGDLRLRLRKMKAPKLLWRIRWADFQPSASSRSA
jgi:hypothetical protein